MRPGCSGCNHARGIIKNKVSGMLMQFTGEDSRKQFYIDNVNRTYVAYMTNQVPYEWFGYVHRMSRSEYKLYFDEELNDKLDEALIRATDNYVFNADHGTLFQVLVNKFKRK